MSTSPTDPASGAPPSQRPTMASVPAPAPPPLTPITSSGASYRDDDHVGRIPSVAATPATPATPATSATPAAAPAPVAGGAELRGRVLGEIKDAVAAARAAAVRAATEPAEAVHEVRKALRRMRAVVDAVRPALARDAHRGVRNALVEARRALGPARDRTVAHLSLAELPAELAEHARALIVASSEQEPQLAAERESIDHAVAEADAQAVALAAALPDDLGAGRIARGLARTYDDARRARRKARRSERQIHRWRRRSKELGYQLALLGDDAAVGELKRELTTVDEQLGRAVDHLLLKDWVGLHASALDAEAASALLTHTHDQLLAGRDEARAASKSLFARRPRKLRKQLRRALKAIATPAPAADATPDVDGTPNT